MANNSLFPIYSQLEQLIQSKEITGITKEELQEMFDSATNPTKEKLENLYNYEVNNWRSYGGYISQMYSNVINRSTANIPSYPTINHMYSTAEQQLTVNATGKGFALVMPFGDGVVEKNNYKDCIGSPLIFAKGLTKAPFDSSVTLSKTETCVDNWDTTGMECIAVNGAIQIPFKSKIWLDVWLCNVYIYTY